MKTLIKKASAFAIAGLASVGLMTTSPVTEAAGERIVFISHAPDSDSWWNTIKNAIKDASEHLGVTVEYRNPPSGDLTDMARIVEQAVASNPQGIVLSIADYDVLKGPVEKATRKLIPVITMNSGTHAQSEQLGALLHVGQPEYDAGFGAGKKAKEAGVTNFLCVNHYITNPASVERCQGFADALGIELGNQMIDSGSDPTDVEKKVAAYLRQHSNTQAVLTLGPTSAEPTLRAVDKMGLGGKIFFATFDLSEEIATGIKDGVINFAIDQQPYLQGYLPVMALTLYNRYGVIPANHINSGPGFITKDNIAMVETLAGEYR